MGKIYHNYDTRKKISWPAEQLLASQEELSFMELDKQYVFNWLVNIFKL
jgi:hypothetical protein